MLIVAGTSQQGAPPSLLLTMTGLQSHYDPTSPNELLAKPTPQLPAGKIIKKLTPEEADQLPRQFAQTLLLVPARDAQGNILAPTPSSVVGGIPHFTYLIARFVALHSTRLTTQRFVSLCRVISPPPSMQYMYNVRSMGKRV